MVFDVTAFGAKGDGRTPAREAIDKTVEAASAAGGGTVCFPAGTYLTGSIRLRSRITLEFEAGATLEASDDVTAYDEAEPNPWTQYQDFGHSHWHNSLIWGEELENIAIVGGGLISGKALARGQARGGGNKAIALKLCRNVTLRDFSILTAGHFGVLATGVDNLTIDNLKIDTVSAKSIMRRTASSPDFSCSSSWWANVDNAVSTTSSTDWNRPLTICS